jgi:hypothetical protein
MMRRVIFAWMGPSEMRPMLAWSACGAWSARCSACRTLSVEAVFRHCGQPGHKDREQQQQHVLMPASEQPYAHCSVCGAARHTNAHTHTHARAHIHTNVYEYTHTYACTHTHTYTHIHSVQTHTYIQTHTHAHIYTCARKCIQARTRIRTNTLTHTHT